MITALSLAKLHTTVLCNVYGEKKKFTSEDKQIPHYEKLVEYLTINNVDPEVYFGLLAIQAPEYFGYSHVVTSEGAIKKYEELAHRQAKISYDLIGFVRSNYKISQKELIFMALKEGEAKLAHIQEVRNLSPIDALMFCIDLELVPDLYVLACKYYSARYREQINKLRPRLNDFVGSKDEKTKKLLAAIPEVNKIFYSGAKELPKEKKVRSTSIARMFEEMYGGY